MLFWILILLIRTINGSIDTRRSCPFFRFQCDNGHCINIVKYCDGIVDCPDGSDEITEEGGCVNVRNDVERKCKLPLRYQCDSVHHCVNKTDEALCDNPFQMRCDWRRRCINKLFLNCKDRPDWTCSDQIPCEGRLCSRYKSKTDVGRNQSFDLSNECTTFPIFRCDSGECLAPEEFCDGKIDCEDGSDEKMANATSIKNGILCSNKWNNVDRTCVLPPIYICDRIDHCDGRIDECGESCKNSFKCNNGRCLNEALRPRCNGYDDCGDASDELVLGSSCMFKCSSGQTFTKDRFCDGRRDCEDGSDEIIANERDGAAFGARSCDRTDELEMGTDRKLNDVTVCQGREQLGNKTCVVPTINVCDQSALCTNLEDEANCKSRKYFTCKNCVVKRSTTTVCNFLDDCGDASDECDTPDGCNKTYTCGNGKCIAFENFCDGYDDCGDNSDEGNQTDNADNISCSNLHNKITRKCILPRRYLCDGLEHCENREDECMTGCSKSFFCDNGDCIPRNKFCDSRHDCGDGSDEKVSQVGLKCRSGRRGQCVVPQQFLCDNDTHCPEAEDDCRGVKCFRCLTQQFYISNQQLCDGIIDCPDLSDECLCTILKKPANGICKMHCTTKGSCRDAYCAVRCDNMTKCISSDKVCNGVFDCADRLDEHACGVEQIYYGEKNMNFSCKPEQKMAVPCDGIPQCRFGHDECKIVSENGTESLMCGDSALDMCKAMLKDRHDSVPACPNRTHIALIGKLCDGREDCEREIGQSISIDERGCANRWKCPHSKPKDITIVTIPITKVCNGIIDCQDEDDEEEELCKEKDPNRFYCENRIDEITGERHPPLYVSMNQVLDSKNDCWDNSDECPKIQFVGDPFSSNRRMIKNVFLVVMIWIMSILAIVGNAVVIWHTILNLRSRRSNAGTMKSNYIVVLNLAIADFLMGIYLLSLAVKNAITNGSYCQYDRDWRGSVLCSGLGTLAVISLYTSVGFLLLLTTYRIKSILSPFSTDSMNTCSTCFYVVLIWSASIASAVVPNLQFFEDFFVSSVQITNGAPFFRGKLVTKDEISTFLMKLRIYFKRYTKPSADFKWNDIRESFSLVYPKDWLQIEMQKFGYYSSNTVCLPTIFVQTTDTSWGFSMAIVAFLFLSFTYLCMAYMLMYRDASKHNVLQRNTRATQENKVLQARITRLVSVDFLCLVPVCVIAMVSVAGVEIDNAAYAVSAILLLPINSALNPLIYSNILGILYSWLQPSLPSWLTKIIRAKRHTNERTTTSNRQTSYTSRASRTTSDGGSYRRGRSVRLTSIASTGHRASISHANIKT